MKKRVLIVALTLFICSFSNAQLSVNDYKYVIVEKQFHFQNEPGEYDLNRLVKFLFRKNGFKVIIEGEPLPSDLKSNYCLALTSEITSWGSLRTKAKVVLRDCDNNVVFTSAEGMTKEKDFARAYDLSIRNAFDSFAILNYKYKPNDRIISQGQADTEVVESANAKQEIKDLKAKIEALEENKIEVKDEPIIEKKKTEVLLEKPKKDTSVTAENIKPAPEVLASLYYKAKSNKNGFDLVNSKSNEVQYILIKTEMENIYLLKNKAGMIYKKGNDWSTLR